MPKMRRRVAFVTMGCSKNLVDSERLMRQFADAGFDVVHEPENVGKDDIVVVNTCGFIGDAKEESVNEILKWGDALKRGKIAQLRVMGCLSERYGEELRGLIPEVTAWYGKTDWAAMVGDIAGSHPGAAPYDRLITTPSHHAYLKIAEGCNRRCAFCAIPLITGPYRSRRANEILAEARLLVSRGVSELNVIAQDLSYYGRDLEGNRSRIAGLVDALADIPGLRRIRLHYAYPTDFPMDLLDVMARRDNVCKYLDIALQHIDDKVLQNMRRHIDGDSTRKLLDEIRRRVPGIHIRTTLMVGFPGETDEAFNRLLDFVREQRFERMGAFAYCEEDDTYAAKNFDDEIPPQTKQSRLDRLMALQEEISAEIQASKTGQVLEVVIDRREGDYMVGRTEFDSPEVDPEVLIPYAPGILRGHYYKVRITGSSAFELTGEIIENEN